MDRTEERAPGKLNLALDVLGKRDDGYHDMYMVMQSVEFCDELTITLNDSGNFRVVTNVSFLPEDGRNIAAKAARVFFDALGDKKTGAEIHILKRLPVCAGMAGGSADAGAVFRALNRLTGRPFDMKQLLKLGESVGSDVPYCVGGGTALATGRGEILTPLPDLPDCSIVICKPRFSVSTPELFAKLDVRACKLRPDVNGMIKALEAGDLRGTAQRMFNVFEDVLPSGRDEIAEIKRMMIDRGALGAVMTGTGSAVFGVYDEPGAAMEAVKALKERWKEVYLTRPEKGYAF